MELGTWFWFLFSSASSCRTGSKKPDPIPVQFFTNWNWQKVNGTGNPILVLIQFCIWLQNWFQKSDPIPVPVFTNWNWRDINGTGNLILALIQFCKTGCRTGLKKSDPVPVHLFTNCNWRNINGTRKRFWLLSSSASSCRTSSKNQTRFQIRRLLLTGTDGCNWPNWVPAQHWDELWTANKSAKHGYCIGTLYPSNLVAVASSIAAI